MSENYQVKDSRPVSNFETQLSELLLLLTQDQLEATRDLLRLLTEGVSADCPCGKEAKK